MITEQISEVEQFHHDLLVGLSKSQKQISPQYFYDAAGSRLFDRITMLDEYYPSRTEHGILRRHAAEMAAKIGEKCLLIEPGAGSLVKVRTLLDRLIDPVGYVPIDVSADHLADAVTSLQKRYPRLEILPVCGSFLRELPIPRPERTPARRVAFFPGSTLGNFAPAAADALLRRLARMVGPNGALLLGLDLQKDPKVLEAAYNDSLGVTAQFNLNLLARANRELGTDFDLTQFRHRAFYNATHGRIEMHLESLVEQDVQLGDQTIHFRKGETIHTEDSHKYELENFARRAVTCGFQLEATWTDERRYFGVLYLTVASRK